MTGAAEAADIKDLLTAGLVLLGPKYMKQGARIADLKPEEKRKIGNLIKELARERQSKVEALRRLNEAQEVSNKRETELTVKNHEVLSKYQRTVELLRSYQQCSQKIVGGKGCVDLSFAPRCLTNRLKNFEKQVENLINNPAPHHGEPEGEVVLHELTPTIEKIAPPPVSKSVGEEDVVLDCEFQRRSSVSNFNVAPVDVVEPSRPSAVDFENFRVARPEVSREPLRLPPKTRGSYVEKVKTPLTGAHCRGVSSVVQAPAATIPESSGSKPKGGFSRCARERPTQSLIVARDFCRSPEVQRAREPSLNPLPNRFFEILESLEKEIVLVEDEVLEVSSTFRPASSSGVRPPVDQGLLDSSRILDYWSRSKDMEFRTL
jgi:hypothetical protein